MGYVRVRVLQCDLCEAQDDLTSYRLTTPRKLRVDLCPEHSNTPIREVVKIVPKRLARRMENFFVDDPAQIPHEA